MSKDFTTSVFIQAYFWKSSTHHHTNNKIYATHLIHYLLLIDSSTPFDWLFDWLLFTPKQLILSTVLWFQLAIRGHYWKYFTKNVFTHGSIHLNLLNKKNLTESLNISKFFLRWSLWYTSLNHHYFLLY